MSKPVLTIHNAVEVQTTVIDRSGASHLSDAQAVPREQAEKLVAWAESGVWQAGTVVLRYKGEVAAFAGPHLISVAVNVTRYA